MNCRNCGCEIKEYNGTIWHINNLSEKTIFGNYGCRNPMPNYRVSKEIKILMTAGNLRKRRWHDFEFFRLQQQKGQKTLSGF